MSLSTHRSRTSDAREHIALLLEVSRQYYAEGRTQLEIAREAMFSRATVSGLLAEARERGIVQFRIGHPLERVVSVERALTRAFGLKQARVADPADPSAAQADVARCAADLLIENAAENAVIAVSNGMAVTATVDAMPQLVWPGSADPAVRRRAREVLVDGIDLCADLHIPVLQLAGYYAFYEEPSPQARQRYVDCLRYGAEYAARRGVLLGIENVSRGRGLRSRRLPRRAREGRPGGLGRRSGHARSANTRCAAACRHGPW